MLLREHEVTWWHLKLGKKTLRQTNWIFPFLFSQYKHRRNKMIVKRASWKPIPRECSLLNSSPLWQLFISFFLWNISSRRFKNSYESSWHGVRVCTWSMLHKSWVEALSVTRRFLVSCKEFSIEAKVLNGFKGQKVMRYMIYELILIRKLSTPFTKMIKKELWILFFLREKRKIVFLLI